jgi:hypothetical protein
MFTKAFKKHRHTHRDMKMYLLINKVVDDKKIYIYLGYNAA